MPMDNIFSQVLGGMVLVWPNVVFMAAVLAALMFRPDRIACLKSLRLACLLFAASLVTPTVTPLVAHFATSSPPPARAPFANATPFISHVLAVLQMLLFVGAFLMLVSAITPKSSRTAENR
jgi:hypothetical protein